MSSTSSPGDEEEEDTLARSKKAEDPHTLVDTDDDDESTTGSSDPSDEDAFELIEKVEWGPRKGEDGYDTDQELAPRPKRCLPAEPCHCAIPPQGKGCLDYSCVLYACREECRSNCQLGHVCGNKRITQQDFKRLTVMPTKKKGKGLQLLEDAVVGDILCEYTGQAIREEALNRLFRRYQFDRRLYILALGEGIYVDARKKGGYARFINHSCEPNCKVERWTVKGILRAAVMALKDIPAGTELTFDYQWEKKEGRAPTVCHCGTPSCRGTLEVDTTTSAIVGSDDEQEWKRLSQKADQTIVNRTIRIKVAQSENSDEDDDDDDNSEKAKYAIGEVTGYDATKKLHCVLYRKSMKEVWEDLDHDKKDWMVLKEQKGNFMIAKKTQPKRRMDNSSLLAANTSNIKEEDAVAVKNYLFVQTLVKTALFVPAHVERIERTCTVKISYDQLARPPLLAKTPEEKEMYAALDQSVDGTVWKLTIQGVEIAKAYNLLEQSISTIHKKLYYHQQQEDDAAAPAEKQEVIFPRVITDAVQQHIGPAVCDKIRSVQVHFVPSSSKSKHFSRLVIEGTLPSDVKKAKDLLWMLLVRLCDEAEVPRSLNCPIHRNLGFFGCELTAEQYKLLVSSSSRGNKAPQSQQQQEFSARDDLLNDSPFIRSFEKVYKCTVWVQTPDDQGRVNRKSLMVEQATPESPRSVYFGCAPDQITMLASVLQGRASELARGVLYIHLGSNDSVFIKLMAQNQFFDHVASITGATVNPDSSCADCLRIDGRKMGEHDAHAERDSAMLADEIVRLQVECYRDECIRQQSFVFGRDWSLTEVTIDESTNDDAIGVLNPKTAHQAGREIADIVQELELDQSVAAHAVTILYRFVHAKEEFSSSLKIREAVMACVYLAGKTQKRGKWRRMGALLRAAFKIFYSNTQFDTESKEAAAMAERVLAAEKEIIEQVDFDIFWSDGELLRLFVRENENDTGKAVKLALEVACSASILSCGAKLWLRYGLKYIVVACAAFLKAHLENLVLPLDLQPLKVPIVAELICQTAAFDRVSKKDPPLLKNRKYMDSSLGRISQQCRTIFAEMTSSAVQAVLKPQAFMRFDIIGRQTSENRSMHGISTELVTQSILPHIESVAAESSCRIHLDISPSQPNTEDLLFEGSWRSIAIAERILREKVPGLPMSAKITRPSEGYMHERTKVSPGLLYCNDIRTADGWKGTLYADTTAVDASGKLGGKCCLPGKVSEEALRRAGLRWWIPPQSGLCQSGSLSSMRTTMNTDELTPLADLARSIAVDPSAFPLLSKHFTANSSKQNGQTRCMPISIQRWPPEKVELKEHKPLSNKAPALNKMVGFSAAALQEMNVLKLLHGVIPSSRGHPNFITPVSIATLRTTHETPVAVNDRTDPANVTGEQVFSLLRSSDDNARVALTEKGVGDCAHLVLPPIPFVLQHFTPRTLNTQISDAVLAAWFYDCLSILVHCHTNNVVLRSLNADNVVVDQSGVLKLGAMYRSTSLSDIDRQRERKRERKHKERLNKMDVDADESGQPDSARKAEKDKAHKVEKRAEKIRKSAKKKLKKERDSADTSFTPYDSPEILLGDPKHSKACDIWSMGCLMLDLVLRKPLFVSRDRGELLLRIFKVIGAPQYNRFPEGLELPYYTKPEHRFKRGLEKHLAKILEKEKITVSEKALDLICRMLHLDPVDRCTAEEAIGHDFIIEYLENSQTEPFRQQFVSDWIKLKDDALVYCQSKEAEASRRKRLSLAVAASSGSRKRGSEEDDLYDLDDLLTDPVKRMKSA